MSLLKVLVVISLLMVAGCYGHSNQRYRVGSERSRAPSKLTDKTMQHEDKLARIKYWWYVPEWKYRLDEVPCYGTAIPPANKAYHYFAPVYNLWYSYYCYASKLSTMSLHNDSAYSSWNFLSPGNYFYPSRRLSYYHVSCPNQIQFTVTYEFELQGKVRISYNEKKCVDYVKITDMSNGSISEEFCGTQNTFQHLTNETYTHDALVTFRSSRYNNYAGFAISATCVNTSSSQIMEECLKVDNSECTTGHARKSVPKYALRKLRSFFHSKKKSEDGVWMMSDDEAVWNADILSLAVLSERSCDAEYKRAGKAVLKLFPQWMVKKEREDYKKDADFNI